MKQYPDHSEDRQYAVANHIFHSMNKGAKRVERHGNPGSPVVTDQYPKLNDKPPPFDHLEKNWQPNMLSEQRKQERYYVKGARKEVSREVPLLGGGTGTVVHNSASSELAKSGSTSGRRGGR